MLAPFKILQLGLMSLAFLFSNPVVASGRNRVSDIREGGGLVLPERGLIERIADNIASFFVTNRDPNYYTLEFTTGSVALSAGGYMLTRFGVGPISLPLTIAGTCLTILGYGSFLDHMITLFEEKCGDVPLHGRTEIQEEDFS